MKTNCQPFLISALVIALGFSTAQLVNSALRFAEPAPNINIFAEFGISLPSSLSLYATNEYGHYDTATYPFFADFPGSQLIEPFKLTTLTVNSANAREALRLVWKIEGFSSLLEGNPLSITVNTTGILDVTVHAFASNNDSYVDSLSTVLISKYVKRELRSLTVPDREAFLDAASQIWAVNSTAGKARYGEQFSSIHTFVREHALASGDIMCDQFHEGSGFLTHHLALSNSFEASLRAVNPAVTLPYWDFTIEGQVIFDAGKTPSHLLALSPVFTAQWFGSVSDSLVVDSRWAHVAMPRVEPGDDAQTPHNSYGYIRSYWNNNNVGEVTRHLFDSCGVEPTNKPVPTCQHHYAVLAAETLAALQMNAPGDGHGPMHVQIGGVFGGCSSALAGFSAKWADYLDADLTAAEVTASGQDADKFFRKWGGAAQRRVMFEKAVMGEYFHIYRSLWRSHMCAVDSSPALLVCPDSCSLDTPFEQCSCAVDALVSGATTWQNLLPCLLNSAENRVFVSSSFSEPFLAELTLLMATASVKEGEMLEAASPADIMFWIIHPVIERLLAAKRVSTVTKMGDKAFGKWAGDEGSVESSWLSSSYYSLAAGQNKWHPEAYTCQGHAAGDSVLPDSLPFTAAMLKAADVDKSGTVTNWEFYRALDPNDVHANDYVFDHFHWDHCEGKIATVGVKSDPPKSGKATSSSTQLLAEHKDMLYPQRVAVWMVLVALAVLIGTLVQAAAERMKRDSGVVRTQQQEGVQGRYYQGWHEVSGDL